MRDPASLPTTYLMRRVRQKEQRDAEASRRLRDAGWTVVRVWECDLVGSESETVAPVESALLDDSSVSSYQMHAVWSNVD